MTRITGVLCPYAVVIYRVMRHTPSTNIRLFDKVPEDKNTTFIFFCLLVLFYHFFFHPKLLFARFDIFFFFMSCLTSWLCQSSLGVGKLYMHEKKSSGGAVRWVFAALVAVPHAYEQQKHFSVLLRINKFEFNLPENDGKPRPHAHRPLILVVHLSSSSARAGSARLDKRHTNEIVVLNVIRLRAIF